MTDQPVRPVPRYSAFLSYSRADIAFVRTLHRQLETYRLPRRLIGRSALWDRQSRRLQPIFRDLDELTAAPDLGTALQEALDDSAFLIVVCSPAAAKSQWVGTEIDAFRARHGTAHILAALIDGDPADALPPALRTTTPDGRRLHPLAADFRQQGDGKRLALLKLVAVMAGVRLDELVRRDAQRRRHRLIMAFGAALIVMIVAALLTNMTLRARQNAARERARSGAMSGFMLDKLRSDLKRYGNLGMLDAVNRNVLASFVGHDLAGLGDAELQQLAKLRLAMGEDAEKRGDLGVARQQIEEARRISTKRLAAAPDDPDRIFDAAQSEYYAGMINWTAGDRVAAEREFQHYRRLADRLIAIDPRNPAWWMEKGYAEANLGTYTLRTRLDGVRAEASFRAALAAYRSAARLRPGDRDAAVQIADAQGWLGDTLRLRGDFAGALAIRQAQRSTLENLQRRDPRDRVVQADLVSNELAVARIAAARQQWDVALAALAQGRAAALVLARDDPENVRRAAQVRIFDLFALRTRLAMPNSQSVTLLASLNGDCARDRLVLKNTELASFCTILAARRLGQPAPALDSGSSSENRLTEVWGLDLRRETKNTETDERHLQ